MIAMLHKLVKVWLGCSNLLNGLYKGWRREEGLFRSNPAGFFCNALSGFLAGFTALLKLCIQLR